MFPAHLGHLFFRNVLHGFENHFRGDAHFRAERVLYLLFESFVAARAADAQHDLVGAQIAREDLDDVVAHARNVLQYVVQARADRASCP